MDGFEEAFQTLFVRAYRVAFRILRDADEAEDIAAEALSRAYLAWRRLNDADHRDAWVTRVTVNLAIDRIRRQRRAFVSDLQEAGDHTADLRLTLLALMRRLPRRQRQVVALRHLVDLPEDEVARVLGISAGAVKQHLHRGLANLRDALAEPLEAPA